MVGSYIKLNDAVSRKNALKQKGFTDAFVVVYKGSQRISMTEAIELQK